MVTNPYVNKDKVRAQIKELDDKRDALEALPTPPGHFAMGVAESGSPTNSHVLAAAK